MQLYSNNAETTLTAAISDSTTTLSVADGSQFQSPTGGNYELITLSLSGGYEIVRMTARSGNTLTVTRAQEGTTAIAWDGGTKVFAGVTAGTLQSKIANETTETGSIAIGLGSGSLGSGTQHAFVYGDGAYADTTEQIAIGRGVYSETGESVAIGAWSGVVGGQGLAVGYAAFARGDGVAVGPNSNVTSGATDAVAIGSGSNVAAGAVSGVAVGPGANISLDAVGGIALGVTNVAAPRTFQVGALYAVPAGNGTEADAAWTMSAGAAVIMSEPLDLTALGSHTIVIPAGLRFFVDEIGVIVTGAGTVTGQPSMKFGITGDTDKFAAPAATVGLTTTDNRHRITTLDSGDGVTNLRSEITAAATATTLIGRVYWRGIAVA